MALASMPKARLGVVVTGGSSGIGRELVRQLLGARYLVFATGRASEKLRELEALQPEGPEPDAARAEGGRLRWAAADVKDPAEVSRVWAGAVRWFRESGAEPFGLCLNAGVGAGRAPLEQLAVEQIDNVLDTNVKGVMLFLREALPTFKEQRRGQVVITSSVAALRACPNAALYAASKFAVHGLLLSLRAELKGSGVKVASVNPAAVATEWWNEPSRGGYSDSGRQQLQSTPLWTQMLAPEAVAAQIIALLEQPESSNIESVVMEASDSGVSPPPAR